MRRCVCVEGEGPTRRPCSLTSGLYVTQLPDDLDHPTSPALAARLRPEGGGGQKTIRLVRAKRLFLLRYQGPNRLNLFPAAGSLGDVVSATLKKEKSPTKTILIHPTSHRY